MSWSDDGSRSRVAADFSEQCLQIVTYQINYSFILYKT